MAFIQLEISLKTSIFEKKISPDYLSSFIYRLHFLNYFKCPFVTVENEIRFTLQSDCSDGSNRRIRISKKYKQLLDYTSRQIFCNVLFYFRFIDYHPVSILLFRS